MFIITDKAKLVGEEVKGVGVMKDEELKLEEIEASHTLGGTRNLSRGVVVYYESMKRELKTEPIYECRCDERLKSRVEESTRLTCTHLVGEPEHLKTETRLIDEMFASEMGEFVFLM